MIATISSGRFTVADPGDCSNSGKFVKHFSLPTDVVNTELDIYDAATVKNEYVLVK